LSREVSNDDEVGKKPKEQTVKPPAPSSGDF
jgi:hypothetical protein